MTLKALFTDSQDELELASVLGLIAFGFFLYFCYHHYITLGRDFDPQSFGLGAGGLSAGHGVGKLMGNKGDYPQ